MFSSFCHSGNLARNMHALSFFTDCIYVLAQVIYHNLIVRILFGVSFSTPNLHFRCSINAFASLISPLSRGCYFKRYDTSLFSLNIRQINWNSVYFICSFCLPFRWLPSWISCNLWIITLKTQYTPYENPIISIFFRKLYIYFMPSRA